MTVFTSYQDVRACIKSGDTIAIKSGTLYGKLICGVLRDDYSHVGIAFWQDDRLLLAEMDGTKNVVVPLSQYALNSFAVYRAPVELPSNIHSVVWESLGVEKNYSWLDILKIAFMLLLTLGKRLPRSSKTAQICTAFNMEFYRVLGWNNPLNGYAVTPGLLCNTLGEPVAKYQFSK